MSRTISFRGQLAMGVQDRISLHTNTGEIGYQITKFQIMSSTPGVSDVEFIAQIYKTDDVDNVNTEPNFSNNRLLGVVYYQDDSSISHSSSVDIIFDNEVFNQDVFINVTDANGGTKPCNYYIEMKTMDLALDESTVATLKDIRNTGSQ